MARIGAVERFGVTGAVAGLGALTRKRRQTLPVWRIVDHPKRAASRGRRQAEGAIDRVAVAAIVGGGRARLPELGDDGAAGAPAINVRRRRVEDEDRPAGSVVAGHDPAGWAWHRRPPFLQFTKARRKRMVLAKMQAMLRTLNKCQRFGALEARRDRSNTLPTALERARTVDQLEAAELADGGLREA